MIVIFQNLGSFLSVILVALFAENIIFARGMGTSRLLNMMSNSSIDKVIFCSLLTLITVITAPMGYLVNNFLAKPSIWYREYIRPLGLVLCAIIAFFIVTFFIFLFKPNNMKSLLSALPMATFNCSVLGPLLVAQAYNYNFVQTMGFGLGSGLAYGFALLLLTEGQRKIDNRKISTAFKGLPINLIYIGILALAILGLTANQVMI